MVIETSLYYDARSEKHKKNFRKSYDYLTFEDGTP
jgi:hypothetical protein